MFFWSFDIRLATTTDFLNQVQVVWLPLITEAKETVACLMPSSEYKDELKFVPESFHHVTYSRNYFIVFTHGLIPLIVQEGRQDTVFFF